MESPNQSLSFPSISTISTGSTFSTRPRKSLFKFSPIEFLVSFFQPSPCCKKQKEFQSCNLFLFFLTVAKKKKRLNLREIADRFIPNRGEDIIEASQRFQIKDENENTTPNREYSEKLKSSLMETEEYKV